ncbi:MAG: oligosaccharide flippase family protein, partial [Desulforhabdus sp.]|nr:oligosaccharide flippase family protein [Desulforhabdus sp.]
MSPANSGQSNSKGGMLAQSAIYSVSLYLCMILGLVRGLVVAKFLGPSLYGIRNAYGILMDFHNYSHLGTLFALNREVPRMRGNDELARSQDAISTVYWGNLVFILVVCAILIGLSFFLRASGSLGPDYCDMLFFAGVIMVFCRLRDYYDTKLKIEDHFHSLSKIQLASQLVGIFACIALTYYFSLRGFFSGLLLGDLVFIALALQIESSVPPRKFDRALFVEMLQVGFPIMAAGVLLMLLANSDKIMILSLLSKRDLGLYGIATIATSAIGAVPSAIYAVTMPKLMAKYGATKDVYRIRNFFEEPTLIIAFLLPFLLASIFFTIHLPIVYYLTKYTDSIVVVQILSIGLYFAAVPTMAISICYALRKQTTIVFLTLPAV